MGWTVLLDDGGNEIGIVGDEAWDIMGTAVYQIADLYQDKFDRCPTMLELRGIFEFVSRPFIGDKGEDMKAKKVYLGDGLYASFDGYHVVLEANVPITDTVFIDEYVWWALVGYAGGIWGKAENKPRSENE